MKLTRLAAGALAAGLLISACGSDKKESTATTTAAAGTTAGSTGGGGGTVDCKPVKPGELSVVTSLPGPNFWGAAEGSTDPSKISDGLEFDLANAIAAKCGLQMKFRNENFDAIVAGQIPADSYDIILSQVTITDKRAEVVDFSVPYFTADQGILVKKGTTVATWDDLNKLKVGVQATTTAEYDLQGGEGTMAKYKLDHLSSFPDLTATYGALDAGTIDAVVIDTPINLGQAAKSGGKYEVVAQFKTGEQYGAIFGKGNGKKAIFDPILQGLLDDGTVTGLITKYFGGDPATVPVIAPAG